MLNGTTSHSSPGTAETLGAAINERFQRPGDLVFLADVDVDVTCRIVERPNDVGVRGVRHAVDLDVTSDEDDARFLDPFARLRERIERLVDNAGVKQATPFGAVAHGGWARAFDLGVWGSTSLNRAAGPGVGAIPRMEHRQSVLWRLGCWRWGSGDARPHVQLERTPRAERYYLRAR